MLHFTHYPKCIHVRKICIHFFIFYTYPIMSKQTVNYKSKIPAELFPIPAGMRKIWTETQKRMFQDYAYDLWTLRPFLGHPKSPTLTDEQWHTIVHNAAFIMNDFIEDIVLKAFLPRLRKKTCQTPTPKKK